MEINVNYISEFTPEFKRDIQESIDWLCEVVQSYEYNRAIEKYGYEKENSIFLNLIDGFTVNFEIWETNYYRPCKYNKERHSILVNMNHFPHLSKKVKAGYIAHEICHELDRFDHGSHKMRGFPYFTQYKIAKMSLGTPFYAKVWEWIKSLFR